jgi:hypothetical protein
MQSVPDHCADKTKDVPHRSRHHDERNGSHHLPINEAITSRIFSD